MRRGPDLETLRTGYKKEAICVPGKPRPGKKAKITCLDLFAGAGGFSTGAEQAGAHVLFAINHDDDAVLYHSLNHPYTMHCNQNVVAFDWNEAPLADLILASPSCKVHSIAASRGGKGKRGQAPKHDYLRPTPWAILECLNNQIARGGRPVVVVENVLEFRKKPWIDYKLWVEGILNRAYQLSENVLCALDFGVPQRRTRLFLVFTPSEKAFDLKLLPKRSCPETIRQVKGKDRLPFKPLIQRGASDWKPWEDWDGGAVASRVRERIKKLKKRLGRVPAMWYWANTMSAPLDVTEPCGTITAESAQQLYLVKGGLMRKFKISELRGAMGFPKSYVLPDNLTVAGKLLGNAVVPQIGKEIVRQIIARA